MKHFLWMETGEDEFEFPKVIKLTQVNDLLYVFFQEADGYLFKIDILKAKEFYPIQLKRYLSSSLQYSAENSRRIIVSDL